MSQQDFRPGWETESDICSQCRKELMVSEWNKEAYGDISIDVPVGWRCLYCNPYNKQNQAELLQPGSSKAIINQNIPF